MEQSVAQPKPREAVILSQIQQVSNGMTGWLKFLGIVYIVVGAFYALSLVGIIIAWVFIYLGVLLLQTTNRITNARFSNNQGELVQMMDKLRLYFIVQGVLIIVSIVLAIIAVLIFSGLIFQYMQSSGFNTF